MRKVVMKAFWRNVAFCRTLVVVVPRLAITPPCDVIWETQLGYFLLSVKSCGLVECPQATAKMLNSARYKNLMTWQ